MRKEPNKRSPFRNGAFNNASYSVGAESSNAIAVAVQLKDGADNFAGRGAARVFLSDNADGSTFSATAPTSALAVGAGQSIIADATAKSATVVSDATGLINLTITYTTGAKTWYLVTVMPDGSLSVSGAITFA